MKHYSRKKLDKLEPRFRAHFINSVTGYKSANLIGTTTLEGVTNLAIFSSITHIGSNPPLIGFVLRPRTVTRTSYHNLRKTGVFTVNHVNKDIIKSAHQTSAKYDEDISEFSETNLTEEYLHGFEAPYVQESLIKFGCSYKNEYHLEENNCIFVIAEIKHIYIDKQFLSKDGWLNLEKAGTVSVTGLDGYALPSILDRFSYAQPEDEPTSIL